MDITSITSTALSSLSSATDSTSQAIGLAMLSKQLDVTDAMSASMIKAMENSVNPAIGGNIDLYV
ncbi:MAG: YjfB family protein [Lachnospiraceae bacterium]|nr:YjfB family protein [Lachnospiraceae bacterium]